MSKLAQALAVPALLAALQTCAYAHDIASPDNQVKVQFELSRRGEPTYAVSRAGQPVLLSSRLGLDLQSADLTRGLRLASAGAPQRVVEDYTLATGKRRQNHYEANERRFAHTDHDVRAVAHCVPLEAEILTRRGFRRYDQVSVGEDVLAYSVDDDRCYWTHLEAITVYPALPMVRLQNRSFDVRKNLAYAPYDKLAFEVPVLEAGDVNARVWIRIREIEQSLSLVAQLLDHMPQGALRIDLPAASSACEGMALVEGFRGDILVWLRLDADGRVARCHLRDPSWFQWPLLEAAIEDNIVADFPLCNKSFNCSYSGHDL